MSSDVAKRVITLAEVLDLDMWPPELVQWEVRPRGMLVQRRPTTTTPAISVVVKFKSDHHNVFVSPQSTFGDLKKFASAVIGVHSSDQKLFFKNKERDNCIFLDEVGIKEGSKVVLVEDPVAKAKRLLEARRKVEVEMAAKIVADTIPVVDKHSLEVWFKQKHIEMEYHLVSKLKSKASEGKKVVEDDVVRLTDLLMSQLVILDDVVIKDDKDLRKQWKAQVRRVRKLVEKLDVIKMNIEQAKIEDHESKNENHQKPRPSPLIDWILEFEASLSNPPLTTNKTVGNTDALSALIKPVGVSMPVPKVNWELLTCGAQSNK